MQDMIELIKDLGLTRPELAEKMDRYYKMSRDLYQKHAPIVKDLYYKENPEEIELDDWSIEAYVYLNEAQTSFERFKQSMTWESEDRNSIVWDYIMDNLKELYEMESSKYLYRAYERTLTDSINTMGYMYYDKD